MTICILCAESVMYVQFLESNKQKQKKERISKNPIVIYLKQPLLNQKTAQLR